MKLVAVEWDGTTPPTAYYKRMHELGLRVMGDKEKSPVERRAVHNIDGIAVVFQEGVYMVQSASLASTIAAEATRLGAKNVRIGDVTFEANNNGAYVMSETDRAIMERFEAKTGKRGRPSDPPQDWVVTCLEEAGSWIVRDERVIKACPHCMGQHFRERAGEPIRIREFDEKRDTPYTYWMASRFGTGQFERAFVDRSANPKEPVQPPSINSDDTERILRVQKYISANPGFSIHLTPREQMEAMDALFCSQMIADSTRKERRIEAVIAAFEQGVPETELSIFPSRDPDKIDILDAACVLGAKLAADHYMWIRKPIQIAAPAFH